MKSRAILVLGHHARRDFVEMLCGMGLEPEIRGSIPGALVRLQRGQLAAVLVDRWYTRVDALEFILNVRDVDATVPIIVIGAADGQEDDGQIRRQSYTAVVYENRDMDVLSAKLSDLLDRFRDSGQGEQDQRVASGPSRETA